MWWLVLICLPEPKFYWGFIPLLWCCTFLCFHLTPIVSTFWYSPGIMLLIFNRISSHVPLKILSIEDGTVLKSFNHLLHRSKKVDFIEQFNEKLLVKQENENLQILDVSRSLFWPCLAASDYPNLLNIISLECRFEMLSWWKLAELSSWLHQHLSFCMRTSCSWHSGIEQLLFGTFVGSLWHHLRITFYGILTATQITYILQVIRTLSYLTARQILTIIGWKEMVII